MIPDFVVGYFKLWLCGAVVLGVFLLIKGFANGCF